MAARTHLGGRRSPVLETLANLYSGSTAGTTGIAVQDYGIRFDELLKKAGCDRGDAYANALEDLASADGREVALVKHRRSANIERVKVPLAFEAALFTRIVRISPTQARAAWAALMDEARTWEVPVTHREAWMEFCRTRAEMMRRGEGWRPFRRNQRHRARLQVEAVARLLAWNQPALVRTASAHVTGSSKFLERSQITLETLLECASGGNIRTFADLGITDNPRSVVFHGPVRIRLGNSSTDYANHVGTSSLSEHDIAGANAIECDAPRCVTVENETNFHELCRLGSGDLFVFTSYPNRATVAFLRRLPATMPRYHFGDTDPWGFDVLRSLRVELKPVQVLPLHMTFRSSAEATALTERDRKKLDRLLAEPLLADVRAELKRMDDSGSKGRFEQEELLVSGKFPYRLTGERSLQ